MLRLLELLLRLRRASVLDLLDLLLAAAAAEGTSAGAPVDGM